MDGTIIDWNGREVPDELRRLPPGRYVLVPVEPSLAADEEDGLIEGLDALDAGEGADWKDVVRGIKDGGSAR